MIKFCKRPLFRNAPNAQNLRGNMHKRQKAISIILAAITLLGCCLPLCAIAFATPSAVAYADETKFVRVIDDDVCLFAAEGNSKVLFVVEQSYYLPVVEETDNGFCVSVMDGSAGFPQIVGYVFKSDVAVQTETPILPYYPQVKIVVSGDSASLRLSPTPSAEIVATALNTQKVNYYGSVYGYDKLWYYVWYCGKFGYVQASEVEQPQIEPHPTPLPSKPTINPLPPDNTQTDDPSSDDVPTKTSPAAEIIMIVFVVILAITLTCCAFVPFNGKKKGESKRGNVFDDDI